MNRGMRRALRFSTSPGWQPIYSHFAGGSPMRKAIIATVAAGYEPEDVFTLGKVGPADIVPVKSGQPKGSG